MNNQQLYELLVNIDNGHIATIEELIELSLVKEIHWHGISVIPRSIVHLVGLSNLDLRDANVSDIRLLSELTALTNLDLSNTYVSDIRPLSGLTVLKNLDLSDTKVKNIRSLAGLIALTSLDLHGSKVIDIRPLVGLTALAILDFTVPIRQSFFLIDFCSAYKWCRLWQCFRNWGSFFSISDRYFTILCYVCLPIFCIFRFIWH